MVVVADLLLAVILMMGAVLALMTIQKNKTPPRIETLGYYVVVMSWPKAAGNDADLYVEDPGGEVAYFQNLNAGKMHLEHDDLGKGNTQSSYQGDIQNQERVVLRGTEVGEYVVNAQMYKNYNGKPTRVTITLYRLRGSDEKIQEKTLVLTRTGDEQTAFRFTLNRQQRVTGYSHLSKRLVFIAQPGGLGQAGSTTPPPTYGGNGTQPPYTGGYPGYVPPTSSP